VALGHVDLRVRDLEASRRFYCDLFGLEGLPDGIWCHTARLGFRSQGPGKERVLLMLTTGLPSGAALTGVDHFAFRVPTVLDVYEAHREARALGAQATEPRVYDGQWQTFIFDPDGYKVEVFTHDKCELPASVAARVRKTSAAAEKAKGQGNSMIGGQPADLAQIRPAPPSERCGSSQPELFPPDSQGEQE
jgi:catechol 2,3-dioxygenase-like lactoylglutathione lyase family enzyme